jgi:hypothetical protein
MEHCEHTRDESWWEYDARGIPLCRVCDKCRDAQLRRYRRDVLVNSNYEADEPIEPEDY